MACLYQIQADGSLGQCWELGHKPLVIGRDDCADVCVEDDALSRSHFLVVRQGVDFFVADMNSINGTWVDGEQISARKLHPHDVIMAGRSLFYFSDQPAAAQVRPAMVPLSRKIEAAARAFPDAA